MHSLQINLLVAADVRFLV